MPDASNIPAGHPKRGVVAVVPDGQRLLVIKRSRTVVAPGAYCFPGGGIHDGESEEAAIVREMREELNIDSTPIRRIWQSLTPWQVDLGWWLVELPTKFELRANEGEVAEITWLLPHEIRSLDGLLESNHHFFDAWDRGEFSLSPDR